MSNRQDSGQSQQELKSTAVGVGLRPEHYQDVLEQAPSIDFLEVHSENFFADAGISVDLLQEVSASTPISLHGTSAGLGSVEAVPDDYLKKLKRLVGSGGSGARVGPPVFYLGKDRWKAFSWW